MASVTVREMGQGGERKILKTEQKAGSTGSVDTGKLISKTDTTPQGRRGWWPEKLHY